MAEKFKEGDKVARRLKGASPGYIVGFSRLEEAAIVEWQGGVLEKVPPAKLRYEPKRWEVQVEAVSNHTITVEADTREAAIEKAQAQIEKQLLDITYQSTVTEWITVKATLS